MATLTIYDEDQQLRIELQHEETTIGRHPDNEIQLTGGTVSGRHARIVLVDDHYFLEDIGSRNGTALNGQRVEQRVPLSHQDEIHFGQTAAYFEHLTPQQLQAQSNPLLNPSASSVIRRMSPEDAGPSSGLSSVQLTADDSRATITSTLQGQSRFGMLDVNPTAKLDAILEISTRLAGSHDLDSLLPKILDTLLGIFRYADRGCILLKDDRTGEMVPRAVKHRRAENDDSIRLSRTIINKVFSEKSGVLSADASSDAQFSGSESIADLRIRSMMCVPMMSLEGEPVGMISIDSQNSMGQFTQDDLDLLMAVAGQAALAYESTRLFEAFVQKQRQDGEMQIAKGIQRALLPEKLPTVEGYEFFASYDSAQAVGGDYYDSFRLPNQQICLSFGDVAGKGVPGALIMSRMHSCVQNTLRHVHDVQQAMAAINDHMCDTSVEGRFVTYVLILIDPQTHQLTLSNAGHMSPVIRHANGQIEQFDDDLAGPPIGVMEGYEYEVESRTLNPGDVVVLVTDGVDEAMNPDGELYGSERMIQLLKEGPTHPAELGKSLLADVRRHANGRPQNDDITIMTLGRIPT